jgi:peptidoglycan hydrolase-like protein with peptidoglycan-binding domain
MVPTPERYKEIQQALADHGHYTGPVNGIWGPDSVEALKRFQQDQNLSPDGKIGALSLIALGLGPKRPPGGDLTGKPESTEPQATEPQDQQ